MPEIRQV